MRDDTADDLEQWLNCHWTQGNAVPAPPITEIQRSYTSKFHTNARGPTTTCCGSNADVQFPHLIFSTLTTDLE